MKKTFIAAALLAAFTFAACSETTTDNADTTAQQDETAKQAEASVIVETPDYSAVAAPFKTQVQELTAQYFELTQALVASNATAAQVAANDVLAVANAMPVATLTTDEKTYAEEKTQQIISSATNIANSEDLAVQRENLQQLSEAVFAMAKAYHAADETLYYQYCPMAFDNTGAYWVSADEEIRNPYFGDAMLSCGSNQEILKK